MFTHGRYAKARDHGGKKERFSNSGSMFDADRSPSSCAHRPASSPGPGFRNQL